MTTETKTEPPVHCAVGRANDHGAAQVVSITCDPVDELAQYPSPAETIAGRYLSTRDGIWKLPEAKDGEVVEVPAAEAMLLPATPRPTVEVTNRGPCYDNGANNSGEFAVGALAGRELAAMTPWRGDAWCLTRVTGCHATWSVECFRASDGWIGGASRGYFDPATSHWSEVRWGDAPPFPFGVSEQYRDTP